MMGLVDGLVMGCPLGNHLISALEANRLLRGSVYISRREEQKLVASRVSSFGVFGGYCGLVLA